MTVPPELRQRSWVAIRNGDEVRLSRGLGVRSRYASVREALARAGGNPVMAVRGEWVFLFGSVTDPIGLSRTWGEVCGFTIDERKKVWRCVRCRQGTVVRRIERIGRGAVVSEGRPGQKREPAIDTVDGATVLAVAEAWRCDPTAVLGELAWVFEPKRPPAVAREHWSWEWRLAAILLVVFGTTVWRQLDRGGPRVEAQCEQEATCPACSACAMTTGSCAPLVKACADDPACSGLWGCFDACSAERATITDRLAAAPVGTSITFDFDCEPRCLESHADGVPAFRRWHSCVNCDACAETCGGPSLRRSRELGLVDCGP